MYKESAQFLYSDCLLPSWIKCPYCNPSYLGLASSALNPRLKQKSASKKEKLLPRQMTDPTFHFIFSKILVLILSFWCIFFNDENWNPFSSLFYISNKHSLDCCRDMRSPFPTIKAQDLHNGNPVPTCKWQPWKTKP